jgi:long-chain acyl-CoA synthetase
MTYLKFIVQDVSGVGFMAALAIPKSTAKTGDRALLKHLIDYYQAQSMPDVWAILRQRADIMEIVALHAPHATPEVKVTYGELCQQFHQCAAGLQSLGVQVGDRVALFADNSPRWFVADQGMMAAGIVNVVRGAQADADELAFILSNSGSTGLVVEDLATWTRLQPRIADLPIRFVLLLSDETAPNLGDRLSLNFSQLMERGLTHPFSPVSLSRDDLATLLYTSGTTGRPKGVMLTHGNLMHQVQTLGTIVQPQVGDRALSILPTWHAYERSCEYFLLSQGCTQVYTDLRNVKADLKKYRPHFMVGVPRLWESIYEGIQKQFREQPASRQRLIQTFLGNSQRYVEAKRIVEGLSLAVLTPSALQKIGAFLEMVVRYPLHKLAGVMVYRKVQQATGGSIKQVISGGGSLAMHIDTFFEMIGVEILVGYGLTETAPVLTARRPTRNMRGSAGQPLPETEIRIVDLETRKPLPKGDRGLVLARGSQVMKGYYQNPEATAKAIDPEGWFDTGDLGRLVLDDFLVLTGRAKDTIVLTNGENIEPQPIEDACVRSAYVDQIMLVGQDQRSLGALIVPNMDALEQWAASQGKTFGKDDTAPESAAAPGASVITLEDKTVQDLIRKELVREVQNRPGYRADDRIGPFRLLSEPFSMENGMMTQTLKIRRPVVYERYQTLIDEMFR